MLFSPKIELNRNSDKTSNLYCPRCGSHNLHQGKVTVFDRSEDEEAAMVVTVVGRSTSTAFADNAKSGNPSSRRHGLAIEFSCENCSSGRPEDRIELAIAQHKGSTEVGWRFTPELPHSECDED